MTEWFNQLSKTKQRVMGGVATTAMFIVAGIFYPGVRKHLLIGLILIVCAVLLWFWYQRRKVRLRARALAGQITTNTGLAPSAIKDPAARAKLDDLRRNFQAGVDKFRVAGKDMYSLPWYVVCGEPGSGKSEAVRHCGVGFPPGLQDEMQGAGGTLNMHWWFTNHAVLLDTAGKLLFQEAPTGATTEWTEFLNLLKKSRPHCPINGLLLVIPSESLIKDSLDEVQRKASKIVQQLNQIQRILDVRFPVFVLVTKCDLINGFREFFSGIKDPQLQHQITGWSNPDPLDQPFDVGAVDQHLETVVQRISRRRLGLLRDPIAVEGTTRRIDEVDSLFSLPASIAALTPRLRRYLETIFVAGEWSARPLFLRGIYFTSALTDGAALDQEIALALRLPVESLPEGKAWVRERSFFLRDLFLQKIFKERGLVTRATNTRKLRRSQLIALGSVVALGLITFSLLTWYGSTTLQESIRTLVSRSAQI
jgi:type VI protein secretion system component VasK